MLYLLNGYSIVVSVRRNKYLTKPGWYGNTLLNLDMQTLSYIHFNYTNTRARAHTHRSQGLRQKSARCPPLLSPHRDYAVRGRGFPQLSSLGLWLMADWKKITFSRFYLLLECSSGTFTLKVPASSGLQVGTLVHTYKERCGHDVTSGYAQFMHERIHPH